MDWLGFRILFSRRDAETQRESFFEAIDAAGDPGLHNRLTEAEKDDFTHRLKQSWAELPVYGYCRVNHDCPDLILRHSLRLCVSARDRRSSLSQA